MLQAVEAAAAIVPFAKEVRCGPPLTIRVVLLVVRQVKELFVALSADQVDSWSDVGADAPVLTLKCFCAWLGVWSCTATLHC